VAFNSFSADLVAGDTNQVMDVFVRDRQAGTTERVSVSSAGLQANATSAFPAISPDGRYVAFSSLATNLAGAGPNGIAQVYLHDRLTGLTELVSVASDGAAANNGLLVPPSISSDGRLVVFISTATNLVSGDSNGTADIFVHDRLAGSTRRISIAGDGAQGNGMSDGFSITPDGRYAAFQSTSSNLVAGDTNNQRDIFVHDLRTGHTERVSTAGDGAQANGASSSPAISADGKWIADGSAATNLVDNDTNGLADVFIRERLIDAPGYPPVIHNLQVLQTPLRVGNKLSASADFTDADLNEPYTGEWDWGDGTTSAATIQGLAVSGEHIYTAAGLYPVKLTLFDLIDGSSSATSHFVVVYDPAAGYCSGRGWFSSPAGAVSAAPGLESTASFLFSYQYNPGTAIPEGNLQFQLLGSDLAFQGTGIAWLVIHGERLICQGSGTLNGSAGYRYLLSAIDGQALDLHAQDRLRVKIWNDATGDIIYDNEAGTTDDAAPTAAIMNGWVLINRENNEYFLPALMSWR
jgi:hypothetical protein